MPQRQAQYPFEWKVFEWANTFSRSLTGQYEYAFFVEFSPAGRVHRVIFGQEPRRFDQAEFEDLQQQAVSFLFYDPYEAPEYATIIWRAVKRATLERLLGAAFNPDDFMSEGEAIEFPETWKVMF